MCSNISTDTMRSNRVSGRTHSCPGVTTRGWSIRAPRLHLDIHSACECEFDTAVIRCLETVAPSTATASPSRNRVRESIVHRHKSACATVWRSASWLGLPASRSRSRIPLWLRLGHHYHRSNQSVASSLLLLRPPITLNILIDRLFKLAQPYAD